MSSPGRIGGSARSPRLSVAKNRLQRPSMLGAEPRPGPRQAGSPACSDSCARAGDNAPAAPVPCQRHSRNRGSAQPLAALAGRSEIADFISPVSPRLPRKPSRRETRGGVSGRSVFLPSSASLSSGSLRLGEKDGGRFLVLADLPFLFLRLLVAHPTWIAALKGAQQDKRNPSPVIRVQSQSPRQQ